MDQANTHKLGCYSSPSWNLRLTTHFRYAVVTTLIAFLFGGCVAEIGSGDSDDQGSLRFGADDGSYEADGDAWLEAVVEIADGEAQRIEDESEGMSLFSNTACVTAWAASGEVVGEVASKGCVIVGVGASATGVGGVAAAVCATADRVNIDRLLGRLLGRLAGRVMCRSRNGFLSRLLGTYTVIHVVASQTSDDGYADQEETTMEEQDCSNDELASWNTQECKDLYCEYKEIEKSPSACKQSFSCAENLTRSIRTTEALEGRILHLNECPKPSTFDYQSHEDVISTKMNAEDNCKADLCKTECFNEFADSDYLFDLFLGQCGSFPLGY